MLRFRENVMKTEPEDRGVQHRYKLVQGKDFKEKKQPWRESFVFKTIQAQSTTIYHPRSLTKNRDNTSRKKTSRDKPR